LITDALKKHQRKAQERADKERRERDEAEKRRKERLAKKAAEEQAQQQKVSQSGSASIEEITDEEAAALQSEIDKVRCCGNYVVVILLNLLIVQFL